MNDARWPIPLSEAERDYLRRRELAELGAAERSESDVARRIHRELAKRYASRRTDPLR